MGARRAEWLSVQAALGFIFLSLVVAAWILAVGETRAVAEPSTTVVSASGRLELARRSGEVLFTATLDARGATELRAWDGSRVITAKSLSVPGVVLSGMRTGCAGSCLRADLRAFEGRPVSLNVHARRADGSRASALLTLPASFPPAAAELLSAARRRMSGARTVAIEERLSNGTATLRSRWEMVAPDRLRVSTSQGGRMIRIGRNRWTFEDGRWLRDQFDQIRAPSYIWDNARHARLIGQSTVAGVPTRVLAAVDRQAGPGWFRLYVTRERRIVRADMFAPAHFMVDRVTAMNRPLRIEPPR